jgi:mRNA interferase HigB
VRVIARHTLVDFWQRYRETEQPLRDWLSVVRRADWSSMADVKAVFAKASIINRERAVFDVLDGNYRLVIAIKFSARIVFIKFIGTHAEYGRCRQSLLSEVAMTQEIKPIRNDKDHADALATIEDLCRPRPARPSMTASRSWRCWSTSTRAGAGRSSLATLWT